MTLLKLGAATVMMLVALLFSGPRTSGISANAYDWPQFNFDAQHSGNNPLETTLTQANVSTLQTQFHVALPATADGAPAYLSGVTTSSGVKDLLFLTTKSGHIVAIDAHNGSTVWSHQYGPGSCRINNSGGACYTTSSPAIDPNRQSVYSYGLDGRVHKYGVGNGNEVTTGGWPELVTTKPYNEKESSALSIVAPSSGGPYLFVAAAGYPGDAGDYQGHVTVIDLTSGSQHVFNALCSNQTDTHFVEAPGTPDCANQQSAIWARPGAVYSAVTGKVYMATGNGSYAPVNHNWGDSVFALNPDGSGASGNPLDSYTPTNFQSLQNADADLGSTAPAVLPTMASSVVKNMGVQGGKDAKLRLVNLANLSGQSGPGHTGGEIGSPINVPQGGQVLTQPAVWTNPSDGAVWTFVATGSGLSGLQVVIDGSGNPSFSPKWTSGTGGTSPVLANGILYYAGGNAVHALDPVTGHELWHSAALGGTHWESPIVVNGMIYMTAEDGTLWAYAPRPSSTPTTIPTGVPTSTGTGASALIQNGGFENGLAPWRVKSATAHSVISSTRAHTGAFSASLCGFNSCSDTLIQNFTVPATFSRLTLTYWQWIISSDTSTACADRLRTRIRNSSGSPIYTGPTACNYNKTSGWIQKTIDLSAALASDGGTQLQLAFVATTDTSSPTSFTIDDVALTAQ